MPTSYASVAEALIGGFVDIADWDLMVT